jgi:hypothetical protein
LTDSSQKVSFVCFGTSDCLQFRSLVGTAPGHRKHKQYYGARCCLHKVCNFYRSIESLSRNTAFPERVPVCLSAQWNRNVPILFEYL